MAKKVRAQLWIALLAFIGALALAFTFRSAVAIFAAGLLSTLSAGALASATAGGKGAAIGSIHLPAVIGAIAGTLFMAQALRGRPRLEIASGLLVSFVAAYFGGVAAVEWWEFGPGGAGVFATLCANIAIAVLDAAPKLMRALLAALLKLLGDPEWLKRLIGARLGLEQPATPPAPADDPPAIRQEN